MRLPSSPGHRATTSSSTLSTWHLLALLLPCANAITYTPVQSPDLDLSNLGRVALTGDFDAISLYDYAGQNENTLATNGSQSLLAQFPNGGFSSIVAADASISTMCPFVLQDGTLAGVVVGGNFTSLGGIEAQGIAMFDPRSGQITPLPGLSGQVNALLCDQDSSTVFVGGEFSGGNSTNAIAWVATAGWTKLPFSGFNGPVNSIARAPDGNVLFGGQFTNLGNTTTTVPTVQDQQIVNIASANISTGGTSETDGFNNASAITCKTKESSGPGNTWLLADQRTGYWRADTNFGFRPTKVRLYNTHQDGRGTKTFRLRTFPNAGLMNLTYFDPGTKSNMTCYPDCQLSNDTSVPFQDFRFVNQIGIDGFQIEITEWYGQGGGLDGIELFQDEIYSYAVQNLNEPVCANIPLGSASTPTGSWEVTPSGSAGSQYLTLNLPNGTESSTNQPSVVFLPDVKQSGNYSVTMYTPGCQQDGTCNSRGAVNVNGTFATGAESTGVQQRTIFQTNDFPKYDQIYSGYVSAGTSSFRPSVTLTPVPGQSGNIQIVAQRVGFMLQPAQTPAGELNGLFEYNYNQASIKVGDFANSNIDSAGTTLSENALVTSVQLVNGNAYVAGNFTADGIDNIFSISKGNASALPNGGLNGQVETTFPFGNILYIGGDFSNTSTSDTPGLGSIASLDTASSTWTALGSGVNGPVKAIVPLLLNITADTTETVITFNGGFDQILAFGNSKAIPVPDGMAIWVPSRANWLQNINAETMSISGQLSTSTNITGLAPLLAGAVSSQGLSASDAVELTTSGPLQLQPIGLQMQDNVPPASSNNQKRDSTPIVPQNFSGATTALFSTANNRNLTIIAGHFSATATNGSTINNLALISAGSNGASNVTGITTGVDPSSTFLALAPQDATLYAGGSLSGTVLGSDINGLILWDLSTQTFSSPQPPALAGSSVSVNAITVRPNSADVFVAGNFENAGSLSCPSLCRFSGGQWSRPGINFAGVVNTLTWQGTNKLLVGGDLTLDNAPTPLAVYDADKQVWSAVANAASGLPGPVSALTIAQDGGNQYWTSGASSSNGSVYISKYDGTNFKGVAAGTLFGPSTTIRGLSMLNLKNARSGGSGDDLLPSKMVLLVTGALDIVGFGNTSAGLYNGTAVTPFVLATKGDGSAAGSLSSLVTEKPATFETPGGHLLLIYIVLIALACALGVIFLLVILGLFLEQRRRRKEGYRPAPTVNFWEKSDNLGRVPPDQLFRRLGSRGGGEGMRL